MFFLSESAVVKILKLYSLVDKYSHTLHSETLFDLFSCVKILELDANVTKAKILELYSIWCLVVVIPELE